MKKLFSLQPRSAQYGLTLIELMISMVLGLLLLLGVVNVYLAQVQSYRVNDNLAAIQNSARTAFELMAREVREAGGNPCGTPLVANVINDSEDSPWYNWVEGGLVGYEDEDPPGATEGTAAEDRVDGTDALLVRTGSLNDSVIITDHDATAAQFKVNTLDHGFTEGDVLMVCDYRQAAIFQVTNASDTNVTIVHNTGATEKPGNCSKGLGYPTECTAVGNSYSFEENGFMTRLSTSVWYVGFNDHGGRSLFRILNNGDPAEIASGVFDMQLEYLSRDNTDSLDDSYITADVVNASDTDELDWANDADTKIVAVRITLSLESRENVSTDGTALTQQMMHVVTLRHRELIN